MLRRPLAVVLALVPALLAGCGGGEAPPKPAYPAASAFADSIGVNVHLGYGGTGYANLPAVLGRLRELGVRHVRDPVGSEHALADLSGLAQLATLDVHADVIAGIPGEDPRPTLAALGRTVGPAVEAIEGPNELDLSGVPDWPRLAVSSFSRLRRGLDEVPGLASARLVAPSLAHAASRRRLPAGFGDGAVANLHRYTGGKPPERGLVADLGAFGVDPRRTPTWMTEAGYHDALGSPHGTLEPVSPEVAAAYDVRALLENFRAGIARTYLYELLDERSDPSGADLQQHFGLLRVDFTPKPAFAAVAELVRMTRATGAASAAATRIDVTAPASVHHLVLRRADGSLVLAVWPTAPVWDPATRRPVPPPATSARVTLSATATEVRLTDPVPGAAPPRTLDHVRAFTVPLAGDAVLAEISG